MAKGKQPYSGQYPLAGPARGHDPRVTPVRGDLADIALAGKLFVPHYVVPREMAVSAGYAPLHRAGRGDAEQVSELLRGERFLVLDMVGEGAGAWAWGYGAHDRYLGYLPLAALAAPATVPLPPPPDGADPASVAELLAGTPYHWGGRGGAGIDCSGLVQTVFARAGHSLPRDSDQQAAAAGRPLADYEAPRRGDLVFFPGHVAILLDPVTVIHASQERGRVAEDQLAALVADRGPPCRRRRFQ